MKKKLYATILLFLFINSLISISCSKEDNNSNKSESVSKHETDLLKKAYGFENISFKNDKSDIITFDESTHLEKLTFNKSSKREDLNLKNVTQINWSNDIISYLIPFANDSKKTLVITIRAKDANKSLNLASAEIVENTVNENNGNGSIILTSIEGSVEKRFNNGVLENVINLYGKQTFRQCFDQAYNDICDGFIGCAAWYASPLPALTAVAYCGVATAMESAPEEPELPFLLTYDEEKP